MGRGAKTTIPFLLIRGSQFRIGSRGEDGTVGGPISDNRTRFRDSGDGDGGVLGGWNRCGSGNG